MQKFMRTSVMLMCFATVIYLGKMFVNTDYFKIKEIKVIGENTLLKTDIINKIESLKESNIVYINTGEIEKLLRQDARIKNVSIRKIYPSRLEVNLEERKPYVYVKKGGDIFLADEELNLFGYIFEEEAKNIPVVIYDGNEEVKKDLKIIVSKIKNKDLYDMISEIRKSDKDYRLILINGIEIITDTLVSTDKYDDTYRLYSQKLKDNQTVRYMDIRFKDINVK